MGIQGAFVLLESVGDTEYVAASLRALTGSGPFRVASVSSVGTELHRCTFAVKHEGMAVGYRNLIDLQHVIAREFDIVSVERHGSLLGC